MATARIRVGIIGCGEVTQVIHLPTLVFLSHLFQVRILCDVSPLALKHCSARLPHPHKTTTSPTEVCSSPDVDVVFVVNSDEYHTAHTILALENRKHVFVEKPMALCLRDADRIIEAESRCGRKVMVGYMRRYAKVFEDALREVGGAGEVAYARVRDIIAPNPIFVGQSGTFPIKPKDVPVEALAHRQTEAAEQVHQALVVESGVEANTETTAMWRHLASLGSHDLSLMREALGMPMSIIGASLRLPIWTVLFRYPNFTVTYESGFDEVPRFDAQLEVFGKHKAVTVAYDTPYVKGLPVTMTVREAVSGDPGAYQERMVRRTYEDPYTLELKELWEMVVRGKVVKTTPQDSRMDLEVFRMVMKAGAGQLMARAL